MMSVFAEFKQSIRLQQRLCILNIQHLSINMYYMYTDITVYVWNYARLDQRQRILLVHLLP